MPPVRPAWIAVTARLIRLAWQVDRRSVVAAGWARIRGKRVRAHNLVLAAASRHPLYHHLWMARVERKSVTVPSGRPLRIVLITGDGSDPAAADRTRRSARAAFGDACLCTGQAADLPAQLRQLAAAHPGAWLMSLAAGDLVARGADALVGTCDADILFGDEDRVDAAGRFHDPWFKPGWDPLRFHYRDFVSGACLIRLDALADMAVGEDLCSWLVRAVLSPGGLVPCKVAGILVHRVGAHDGAQVLAEAHAARIRPLLPPGARAAAGEHGLVAIDWPLADPAPRVSVMVPTRDGVELLATCIAGLDRTVYPGPVELIIVDNDSGDPATATFLDSRRSRGDRVIRFQGPFNFPAINAAAAAAANGDYLCLLNNDVDMPDPDWLARMVALASRPGAGAVGIQLRYPDGTIQHAGVVAGIGAAAGHVLRGQDAAAPLHHALAQMTREVTIVTAACLVIARTAWDAVGGMDAEAFPVAFNDVDLCLRLQAAGYRNAYLGDRALIHHESKTRGSDLAPSRLRAFERELAALHERWDTVSIVDPYYNPLLTRRSEQHFAEIYVA